MLYARQLAWLQHRPEKTKDDPEPKARAERIEEDGGQIQLPELDAPYLLGYLHELGFAGYAGMGLSPLAATEIEAWARGTHTTLRAWEFKALQQASSAYVGQKQSTTEKTPPPYGSTDDLVDPSVIDERLEQALAGLAKPRNKKEKR